MENTNWLKQTSNKPLFEDLLWSRPENKAQAGKLLIIGGNSQGFSAPAEAFAAAEQARAGAVRVLLPDSLKKALGKGFLEADFAPSNPSGGFGRQAVAQFIEHAEWADGVLLAGDFGKNSETAIAAETFLAKYKGAVIFSRDSLDFFSEAVSNIFDRPGSALVTTFSQLQALAKNNRPTPPITSKMPLYGLVKALAGWSNDAKAAFVTVHEDTILVAYRGKVSSTPIKSPGLASLAAYIGVWLIQSPAKPFEALTSAVFECQNSI